MNRQEAFEKAYAEAHSLPLETFAQYRMGETYRLPLIAKCWRFWNLALDSTEKEFINGKENSEKPQGIHIEDARRSVLFQIEKSANVTSIQPLADKTNFVLSDDEFDSFQKLLSGSPKAENKTLQNFLSGKSRWADEGEKS